MRGSYGIAAVLENFDFDAHFSVTGFDIVVERAGSIIFSGKNDTGSGLFSAAVKEVINQCKVKDRVTFKNIRAKGPDGFVRDLNEIDLVIL